MVEKAFSFYGNAKAKDLHLYIECGVRHLAFWLKENNETKQIVSFELFYFKAATFFFKEVFEKTEMQSGILNQKYRSVNITWENSRCVCIPQQYFSSDMMGACTGYLYSENNAGESLYTFGNEFSVAYKTDPEQYKVLTQYFPAAKHFHKYHSFSKVISGMEKKRPALMYVALFYNYYIISAFDNGQMQFINRLQYASIPDTVKTIENATNLLQWNAENTALIVSGIIDEQSALYNQLAKHFALLKIDDDVEFSFDNAEELVHSPLYYLPYFKFGA
ncbi:MAG: DUF3822 family protein [Chitinophagaceae bacterium]|jgi:hypothetical protein|nr:DUF3822 family protein [Chitinophagaceae bacterium]